MENNYPKAYKEVMEILKYVPKESVEQELLEETKAIFANIFRDYWATPYQKKRIQAKERYDRQKIEEEKRAKYNSDIFKTREIDKTEKEVKQKNTNSNNLPIEIKKEKFYEKIISFFKKIFYIDK